MRKLRNVQSFKTYVFRFWTFCHERDTGQADYPTLTRLHGKLSPRLTGLPYLADRVTRLGGSLHLLCKRDQDKVRNYMDRRVSYLPGVLQVTICHVNVSRWGNPPSRGRFHEKKALKPNTYVLKLCTFPSRRNHKKPQRIHKQCKMFTFRHIWRCKSTNQLYLRCGNWFRTPFAGESEICRYNLLQKHGLHIRKCISLYVAWE